MDKNNFCPGRLFTIGALAVALLGCGISGTGGPSRGTDNKQTPQEGQAVLGPIIGATVTLRDIEKPGTIACTATTADNEDLARAGTIKFGKPCIYADHLYLATVAGGSDVDYDDDGVRDATPTANAGEFRALLSGEQLLQANWKTNALTESAYQALQYALQQDGSELDATTAIAIADDLATQFVREDLNGDGRINRFDIAQWHPVNNASAATNTDKLQFATTLIHQNLNRTLTQIPASEALAGHIDTLAPARQVLNYNGNLLVTTDTALLIYRHDDNTSVLLASLPLGWIYDMTLVGSDLYVALGENGIARIDVSDASNPRTAQRWPAKATRITNLAGDILFSAHADDHQQPLMWLPPSGEPQQLALENAGLFDIHASRRFSTDESIRHPLLKTIGDTVYWAPGFALRRFVRENGNWRELAAVDAEHDSAVQDIEVIDNTLYMINRDMPMGGLWGMKWEFLYSLPDEDLADALMGNYRFNDHLAELVVPMDKNIKLIDISDRDNPFVSARVEVTDVRSLRQWDGNIIALGDNVISYRNPINLAAETTLPLPTSFTGFYPAKGLDRVGTTLVVAAKENGVLFLKTPPPPTRIYTGKVFAQSELVNASVVVQRLADGQTTCSLATDASGNVQIAAECISQAGYYSLTVSGGSQIVDGSVEPFHGTVHTLMHSTEIASLAWTVSPLTEIAWQLVHADSILTASKIEAAQHEIANWLLVATDDYNGVRVADLFSWDAGVASLNLNIDASKWDDAVSAIAQGQFDGNALSSLLSPVTRHHTFGAPAAGTVIINGRLFVGHANNIDIFSTSSVIWPTHSLAYGANYLFAQASKLIALSTWDNTLHIFDTTDPDNVALLATFTLPPEIDSFFPTLYCSTGDTLYRLMINTDDKHVISIWRIENDALVPVGNSEFTFTFGGVPDSALCDNERLVTTSSFGGVNVFQLGNNGVDLTATITTVPILAANMELHNDRLYVTAMDFDGQKQIRRYDIDASGAIALMAENTIEASTDSYFFATAQATDNVVAVLTDGRLKFLDASTLNALGTLDLQLPAPGFFMDDDSLWLLNNRSLWHLDMPY